MQKFVIKMGGSLLFQPDLSINSTLLTDLTRIFAQASHLKGLIIGGGVVARKFIHAARQFHADEAQLDQFGIEVSRLNAHLLQTALGHRAYPKIITSLEEVRFSTLFDKIIIAGGFIPGQSTTSVTFEIAEALGATDVLILTDVDGIYDKDPDRYLDATKYDQITIAELEHVIYGEGGDMQAAAGEYRIFDAVSTQIFKRSQLSVRLLNGTDPTAVKRILFADPAGDTLGTQILR